MTEPSDDSVTAGGQIAAAFDRTTEVVPPPVVNVDAAKMETAKAVADLTAKAHLAKAANPAPVTRRPIVSAPLVSTPPQRRSRTPVMIAAAAVIVVAIGAAEGARRLGYNWPSRAAAREGQAVEAMPAVEAVTAERRATPPDTPSAKKVVTENRSPAIAPAQAAARPKARPAAVRPVAVRRANSSDQQAAHVVATAPKPETPAPVPTRSPAQEAAESPRASAPLTGRFFERRDVDEAPQIATRVEPRLPANLPVRARNAVVVVRLLVSRTGHPHHVSLLRGSMLGRASDEAVVAAVTQWTFSPATKRGEPVNCWHNIGVPLGQAD